MPNIACMAKIWKLDGKVAIFLAPTRKVVQEILVFLLGFLFYSIDATSVVLNAITKHYMPITLNNVYFLTLLQKRNPGSM